MKNPLVCYIVFTLILISCGGKSNKGKVLFAGSSNQVKNTESGSSALPQPNELLDDKIKYGVHGKVSTQGDSLTPVGGVLLSLTTACNAATLNSSSASDGKFSLEFFSSNSCDNQTATACQSLGKVNVPSSDGAKCVSGEKRVLSSLSTISLTYGCWGYGCYGESYLATSSVGKYCYTPGQK